jgi:uncharacterized iron-regulated membrane protein
MRKFNKLVFSIHSWLGLIAGIFILAFFLTGSVIVFRKELNHCQHPELFTTTVGDRPVAYDSLYRSVQQQAKGIYLYSFRYLPEHPAETIEMRVYDPVKKIYGLLYADPYTARVLGYTWNDSLYDILLTLHYTFFLGRFGELLAAIFALALLGSIGTGLYVYRKNLLRMLLFRKTLYFDNWRKSSASLHHSLGAWGLVFNFVLAFSGFYMMMYALDIKTHFGTASNATSEVPPVVSQNLDRLIATGIGTLKEGELAYLDFPRKQGDPVYVYAKGGPWLYGSSTNWISFDASTGEIKESFRVSDLTAREKFEYSLYTLHYGQYGGTPVKILYCLFALGGAVLTITGFALWYRKRRRSKQIPLSYSQH